MLLLATYFRALSTFVAPFAAHLLKRGFDVVMAASDDTLSGPSTRLELVASGFTTEVVPFTNHFTVHRDIAAIASLWRLLERQAFDIVHTHTAKAGFLGRITARAAGVPVVVHTAFNFAHADSPSMAWAYLPLEVMATAGSDRTFCISKHIYDQAAALPFQPKHGLSNSGIALDPRKLRPVGNRQAERERLLLPLDQPVIGTAARLVPHKGIDTFLKIVKKIACRRPDVVAVVLGTGPEERRLHDLAEANDLSRTVRFIPYLERDDDVMGYLRALDVFILPTDREGFGMVFAEAMSVETPVVGPNIPPVNEIITHGDTGLLADRHDIDGYVGAVERLLADAQLRQQLAARGRQFALSAFNAETIHGRIEAEYRELLAIKGQ